MTFEEALKEFKQGKAIRLTKWTDGYTYKLNRSIEECSECDNIFSLNEILSDDWEVLDDTHI